jgi:hypothetical protein
MVVVNGVASVSVAKLLLPQPPHCEEAILHHVDVWLSKEKEILPIIQIKAVESQKI